jgi:hypothetical protein
MMHVDRPQARRLLTASQEPRCADACGKRGDSAREKLTTIK